MSDEQSAIPRPPVTRIAEPRSASLGLGQRRYRISPIAVERKQDAEWLFP
jgi:hypothetical protein